MRFKRLLAAGIALAAVGVGVAVTSTTPTASATGGDAGKCYEQIQVTKHRWQRDFGGEKQVQGWEYSGGQWRNRNNSQWYTIPSHLNPPFYGNIAPTGTVSLGYYGGPSYVTVNYRYPEPGTEWYPSETGFATEAEFNQHATGGGWRKVATTTVTENGDRIPCEDRPDDYTVERTDNGTCDGPGDTTATVTVYGTDYVYVLTDYEWVAQQDGAEYVISRTERTLSADEQANCTPSKEPKVEREDVGEPACGDTTIDVEVTTTTYTYTYENDTWVEHESTSTTYETRDLTEQEQYDCPTSIPVLTATYDCYGETPSAMLNPSTSDHWTAGALTHTPESRTYSITITPDDGYSFGNDANNADGSLTLTASYTVDTDCVTIPIEPTYTPPTCQTQGSVEAADAEGYTWNVTGPQSARIYTAVADQGHRFAQDAETVFGPFDMTFVEYEADECQPTFSVEVDCGFVKLTYTNNSRWDRWPDYHWDGDGVEAKTIADTDIEYYTAVKVLPGETKVIVEHSFAEDFNGGSTSFRYQDRLGAEADISSGPTTITVDTNCDPDVIEPPAIEAGYDCVEEDPVVALTPASSAQWSAADPIWDNGTVSIEITAADGFVFAEGQQSTTTITLVAEFDEDDECEFTATSPTFVPPTCDAAGSVTLPESSRFTWVKHSDDTYTAMATEGTRLIGPTTFGPFEVAQLKGDDCAEPTIEVAAFSPVCQADIPYIDYRITVANTPATTAKLTFTAKDGDVATVHENVPLVGRVIYPGASENPVDWPGWRLNDRNEWVIDETADTDADWRDGLTVTVEVNPTATGAVTYPPATAICNSPVTQSSGGPTTTVASAAQQPEPGTTQLPPTGSNSTRSLLMIGALVLGGGALLVGLTRRRTSRRSAS